MFARPASRRAAVAALLCLAAPAAFAQDALFAGKTVTIYIGNTAGGSYDLYGRIVSRYLGKHLPGNPSVIASNMPGAGTLKAANYIYSVAPKDGTAIGVVTETLALEQAVANPAVQFDAAKFLWIGRAASSNNIHFQWHTAKVQSIEDAKKTESAVAAAGAGNISEVVPKLLNAVIGTRFKVISGYPASAEGMLAMERGEVEGTAGSWASVKITKKAWLDEKKIKIILQDVPTRSPELPDVPALGELGDTPDDKAILGLYASGGAVGRAFLVPPGTQPAALKALQDGFAALMKDPEFLAEAAKANLDIEYSSPQALGEEIRKTLATPPQVIARAKAIFGR
jgi:tripartite-type tricarboxylate transporter receptor subunit TctC